MKLDAIAAHLTNVKFTGLLNLNRCGHCSCLFVMMAAHTSFMSFFLVCFALAYDCILPSACNQAESQV